MRKKCVFRTDISDDGMGSNEMPYHYETPRHEAPADQCDILATFCDVSYLTVCFSTEPAVLSCYFREVVSHRRLLADHFPRVVLSCDSPHQTFQFWLHAVSHECLPSLPTACLLCCGLVCYTEFFLVFLVESQHLIRTCLGKSKCRAPDK